MLNIVLASTNYYKKDGTMCCIVLKFPLSLCKKVEDDEKPGANSSGAIKKKGTKPSPGKAFNKRRFKRKNLKTPKYEHR